MAQGKKISELTELSSVTDNDEFLFVDKEGSGANSGNGGSNVKIKFSDLKMAITDGMKGEPGMDGEKGEKGSEGDRGFDGGGAVYFEQSPTNGSNIYYKDLSGSLGIGTDSPHSDYSLHIKPSLNAILAEGDVTIARQGPTSQPDLLLRGMHENTSDLTTDYLAIKCINSSMTAGNPRPSSHIEMNDKNASTGATEYGPNMYMRLGAVRNDDPNSRSTSDSLMQIQTSQPYIEGEKATRLRLTGEGKAYLGTLTKIANSYEFVSQLTLDDGNVGIGTGTNSIIDNLEVRADNPGHGTDGNFGITIRNMGANPARLSLLNSEGDGYIDCNNGLIRIKNVSGSDARGIMIAKEGEVGINTDEPQAKLHIKYTETIAGYNATEESIKNAAIRISSSEHEDRIGLLIEENEIHQHGNNLNFYTYGTGSFDFWVNNDLAVPGSVNTNPAGSAIRALKINNEGFIGMSTHDPIRKLHIASKIQSQPESLAGTITILKTHFAIINGSGCSFTTDFEVNDSISFRDSNGKIWKRRISNIIDDNTIYLYSSVRHSDDPLTTSDYWKCIQERDTEMCITGPDEAGTGLFLGTSGKYNDGFPFKVASGDTNAGDGDGANGSYQSTGDLGIESCSRLVSSNGNLIVGTHKAGQDFMVQTGSVRRLQIVDSGSASTLHIFTSAIRDRQGSMLPGVALLNQEIDFPIESQGVQDATGELHYQDILVFKAMGVGNNGRGAGRIHISFTGGYHAPSTYTLDFFKSYTDATPSVSNLRMWGGTGYVTNARAVSYTKNGELYHAIQIKLSNIDRSAYPELTYMSKFTVQVEAIGYNPSSGFDNDKYVPYDNAPAHNSKFKALTVTSGPIGVTPNAPYGAGQTAQLVADYQGSKGEFLTDEDKKLAQSVIDGSYSMPETTSKTDDLESQINSLKKQINSLRQQIKKN